MQEFPVEVIPNGVVNETLRSLGFTSSLVLENHIIIPPEPYKIRIRIILQSHADIEREKF
uniref:Protein CWC15 homolog n=1 Tax=Rhizophora mucronata TaxID=61149 RepID=A0A2P2JA37_RHIMU